MWCPGERAGNHEARVHPDPQGLGQDVVGTTEDPTYQPLSWAWAPGKVQAGGAPAPWEERCL